MTQENVSKEEKEIAPKKGKRGWLAPTVTTLIGVAVSLLVAWYQIDLNEEQALLAEIERSKGVKRELVLIVEEYIINEKALDISTLARLAEFRAKQERLLVTPTVSEIIESAEFNILKSQYLEFEKKEQFKSIFNNIYAELSLSSKFSYSGIFENSVNDLYASIQKGNTKEASNKLNKLLVDFNSKIDEISAEKSIRKSASIEDIFRVILDDPSKIIVIISAYAALLYIGMFYRRKLQRRKRIEREMELEMYRDYVQERDEVMWQKMRGQREPL